MIFSVITLLLVLLIAYWWANAGVFDALLHMLCVIIAGALAFALWEPITTRFLLDGGFAEYAWGVVLGGVFIVALIILRLIVDAACPFRPKVPRIFDWTVGLMLGLVSGVLTMGMVLIAIGHISSSSELLGYHGWKRQPGQNAPVQTESAVSPANIVMTYTGAFYGLLSDNAFAPTFGSASLARWRPDVAADGGSLLRDSIDGGKGRFSVNTTGVSVIGLYQDPTFVLRTAGSGAYAVLISMKRAGFDHGAGFTLSASQARLIDGGNGSSAFPVEFSQIEETSGQSLVRYEFKGDTAYLSTTPKSEESIACLIFPMKAIKRTTNAPLFLQIKGLRFELPISIADVTAMSKAVTSGGKSISIAIDADTPVIPAAELRLDTGLQGAMLDKNALPGSLKENNGKLTSGAATRIARQQNSSGDVRGIEEPPGQRVVMLKCSRDSAVDLFNVNRTRKDAEKVGPNGEPVLVDDKNNIYAPVGYIWKDDAKSEHEIYLESPEEGFTVKRFRRAENNGELNIIYRVPSDVTIVLVVLRDASKSLLQGRVVGQIRLKIEPGMPTR